MSDSAVEIESNVVVIEDEEPDGQDNVDNVEEVECDTPKPQSGQSTPRPRKKKNYQNDRYNNAYGGYSGGYGPPGGGFGPPGGGFGPPGGGFGPPGGGFGPHGGYGPPGGFGPPGGGYGRNFQRMSRNFGPPPPPLFPPGGLQGPPNPYMWGRGFGPDGPPARKQPAEDRTVRYLMRCGVGKEYLKNMPRDMLQLIEPEYCGLCAHSFDSFATSRLHYISKNHLKNHKKWLNQQSEFGLRRAKEIALKARELYCELCDVHITSKSHSESHYAGKPHRAIVEGRKNPKNPFLLQRGMEDRVALLIRREKRHIKVVDDDDEPEKTKETKNIQSELHCEICKTSVTCTEQMTMHLNGKRHLSREKQHILKVMKGDVEESGDAQGEEAVEDMEEGNENENENEEEVVAEKKTAAEVDNYDWGNGSGAWDEIKNDDVY